MNAKQILIDLAYRLSTGNFVAGCQPWKDSEGRYRLELTDLDGSPALIVSLPARGSRLNDLRLEFVDCDPFRSMRANEAVILHLAHIAEDMEGG